MEEDEVAVEVEIDDEEDTTVVTADDILKGDKGEDGYTPVKGVDYYTDEEKEEFQAEIMEAISEYTDQIDTNTADIAEIKETVSTLKEDTLSELVQDEGYVTVEEDTTLTNGYEITLPVSYYVGDGTLEIYWNGRRLIPKTDDNDDGHYVEVGETGELSNVIQMYRTDSDGDYTLTDDAYVHAVVKGKKVSAE